MGGARLGNPLDPQELARHALRLLDSTQHEDHRQAARRIAERYSWDQHLQRILEIYEKILIEKQKEQPSEGR